MTWRTIMPAPMTTTSAFTAIPLASDDARRPCPSRLCRKSASPIPHGYGMGRHLNLPQIKAFKAVIENGLVSYAALMLNISQRPQGPPGADRPAEIDAIRGRLAASRRRARSRYTGRQKFHAAVSRQASDYFPPLRRRLRHLQVTCAQGESASRRRYGSPPASADQGDDRGIASACRRWAL
jgi:hypothetical protein